MIRAGFLALLCCVASAAAMASKPVYKWKDADGGLHFTDTPPPAGATLIKDPPTAANAPAPALPAAQPACDADAGADPACTHVQQDAEVAAIKARECAMLQREHAILVARRDGRGTVSLTNDEQATLPAAIADHERRIAELCP